MYKAGKIWLFMALSSALTLTCLDSKQVQAKEVTDPSPVTKQIADDPQSENQTTVDTSNVSTTTVSKTANATASSSTNSSITSNSISGSSQTTSNPSISTSADAHPQASQSNDDNGDISSSAGQTSSTTSDTYRANSATFASASISSIATSDQATGSRSTTTAATTTLAATQAQSDTNETTIPSGGTVADDITTNVNDNLLSYAANFHIFANQATLSVHTDGNLAVGELVGQVNFGTDVHGNTISKDLYYIGKVDQIANSSFVDRPTKVVFGTGMNVYTENGQVYVVDKDGNSQRLDHLKDTQVFKDQDGTVYIDIQSILSKLSGNSATLYTQPVTETADFSKQDPNSRSLNLSGLAVNKNNQIIINIKASDLEKDTPIIINGVSKDATGPNIIFNVVDDSGNPISGTINSKSKIVITYTDGTQRTNQETENFDDAHLLWNFGSTGELDINAPFQGSVLAP